MEGGRSSLPLEGIAMQMSVGSGQMGSYANGVGRT